MPFDEVLSVQLVPEAASQARHVVRERLLAWDVAVDHEVVVLLVSEGVCNAVQHGRPPASLRLTWDGITFGVEVRDAGMDSLPVQRTAAALAESGRGLALVDALADNWGVEIAADSKALWFEVCGRRDDDPDDGFPTVDEMVRLGAGTTPAVRGAQQGTTAAPLGELPTFRVEVLHQDGSMVVGLVGELDALASDSLTAEIRPLLARYSASQVTLDCARLRFLDHGGLRTLLSLCHELEPDGEVKVRNPPGRFRQMTELLDPDHCLDIADGDPSEIVV